jgi:hypothetical protein
VKTVGKRKPPVDFESMSRIQKLAIELRGERPFIPKGVHRFKTFKEAQDWTFKMLTRKPKGVK